MLFRSHVRDGLVNRTIDLAFRDWKRASVRAGSTFRTAIGVVRVESIDRVAASTIDDGQARRAGYATSEELRKDLKIDNGSTVFRMALAVVGPDARVELRETVAGVHDVRSIRERLDGFDRSSRTGNWTRETLRLIGANPAVRAANPAAGMGLETLVFKRRVRQLKELGLTEVLRSATGCHLEACPSWVLSELFDFRFPDERPLESPRNDPSE